MPTLNGLYLNSTTHTVNGRTARKLVPTLVGSSASTFGGRNGSFRAYKVSVGNVTTLIANGSYTLPAMEDWEEVKVSSLSCPQTSMALTDAVMLELHAQDYDEGWYDSCAHFISDQLGATALTPAIWQFQHRIRYFSEVTTHIILWYGEANSQLSNIAYSLPNTAPNAPAWNSPANNTGYTINRRPKFKAQVSDPDGNAITSLELQVAANTGFSSGVQTFTFNGSWASSSIVTLTPNADLPTGTRYARVRAYDGQTWGNYSATLQITVKTDVEIWSVLESQIASGIIMAGPVSWLTEARAAVNAARQFRGLSAQAWTDSSPVGGTTAMRGVHLREIRTALAAALSVVGVTPVWTDTNIVDLLPDNSNLALATSKKGEHLKEIMAYIRSA